MQYLLTSISHSDIDELAEVDVEALKDEDLVVIELDAELLIVVEDDELMMLLLEGDVLELAAVLIRDDSVEDVTLLLLKGAVDDDMKDADLEAVVLELRFEERAVVELDGFDEVTSSPVSLMMMNLV